MGITPNLKKLLTLLYVPNFLPILKGKPFLRSTDSHEIFS